MKTEYETMRFEQSGDVWYAKSERCLGSLVCVLQDNFEWVSDDGVYLSAAEHRDIANFLDELNKGGMRRREICVWTHDETHDCWDTDCGHGFSFINGGPKENKMKFCCYCARKIKEQKQCKK